MADGLSSITNYLEASAIQKGSEAMVLGPPWEPVIRSEEFLQEHTNLSREKLAPLIIGLWTAKDVSALVRSVVVN